MKTERSWWREWRCIALFWWVLAGLMMDGTAGVTVSDVRAAQRTGTKFVDIDYNLTGTTAPATVSLRISNDDGVTFGIPSIAVSGAIGGGIASGLNKRIVWNAGADWNDSYSPKMRFEVTAQEPSPTISLSANNLAFGGQVGQPDPVAKTVGINNSGGDSLINLSSSVVYASGPATGWLSASLDGTTAPATLTLQCSVGTLTQGSYTAVVSIASTVASNSPEEIAVTFNVDPPSTGPVLTGPASSTGSIHLTWTYAWTNWLGSTRNGYELEESTVSSTSGFNKIWTTLNQNDRETPKSFLITSRAQGNYWYRVRAALNSGYSGWSNVKQVNVTSPPTVVRFSNTGSYAIVSLVIDGQEQYPYRPLGLLPGNHIDLSVSSGGHAYTASSGYWEYYLTRFTFYDYGGSFNQPANQTYTITLPDPTIRQLLPRFGNSATWKGDYWENLTPHTAKFTFYNDGTLKFYVDNSLRLNGSYALVSRNPAGFSVTFSVPGYQGTLFEVFGYFTMYNGPGNSLVAYYPE